MPRFTASSASSRGVQCVTGRPDFSGGSLATARICAICSVVNLPPQPARGRSPSTRPIGVGVLRGFPARDPGPRPRSAVLQDGGRAKAPLRTGRSHGRHRRSQPHPWSRTGTGPVRDPRVELLGIGPPDPRRCTGSRPGRRELLRLLPGGRGRRERTGGFGKLKHVTTAAIRHRVGVAHRASIEG